MAVSAGANLQWLGAAVTSVPLATMALAPRVVKVFTGLIPPVVCPPSPLLFFLLFLVLLLPSHSGFGPHILSPDHLTFSSIP